MYRLALVVVLVAALPGFAHADLTCPGCTRDSDCARQPPDGYGSAGTCVAGRCSNEGASCPLRCPACRTDLECGVYGSGGTCVKGRCSNEGPNCCATLYGPGAQNAKACGPEIHSRLTQSQRNILFVLSDDIGYCHAGFMVTRGVCANTGRLCTSNSDCSGQPCEFEISCRNRKPGVGKDAGSFPYNRSQFSSVGFPVQTPFLDDLATKGVVFTRAHVAAGTCTSSRQTFLTGRYQRHTSYLKYNDHKSECVTGNKVSTKPAAGCSAGVTCTTGSCVTVRAIPNELKEAAVNQVPPATPSDFPYLTLGAGKTEFIDNTIWDNMPEHRKKPGVGKFHCTDVCGTDQTCGNNCDACSKCQSDLAADRIPNEAAASVDEITSFVDQRTFGAPVTTTTLPSSSPQPRPVQNQPFFIWYGPNIPHDGATPDKFFRDKYENDPAYKDVLASIEKSFFARVSWMDFGVRTVADHLQRTCTCSQDEVGGGFSWKPLYDSTVVIYAGGDQGFQMPNAKHHHTENGHRMVLIVSDPEHRRNPLTARAFPNEFAATPDVLPTVLAYAGISPSLLTPASYWYDYGRNLKPWVDGTAAGHVRDVQYSERGASNIPNPGGPQYMINRPGMVGVCTQPSPTINGTGHMRPCLTDWDCNFTGNAEGPCIPADQVKGRRCINRPNTSCTTDGDCAVGLCNGSSQCVPLDDLTDVSKRQVSYKEYDGADCSAGPASCVPAGVCRPIMLKAEVPSGGVIRSLWDVNWTPDQYDYENLLKLKLPGYPTQVDASYLGPCLRAEMQRCLYKFEAYEPLAGSATLPQPEHPAGCPTSYSWCP